MPEDKLLKKASLEERIKCILHIPALEMDGNAYKGKYELKGDSQSPIPVATGGSKATP
jgi:hypothetical protein